MKFFKELDIEKVKLWKKNPRINDKAAQRLVKVLQVYGFIDPIIIDENYVVRAGNTRVKAAKLAGIKYIPALMVDFKSEEAAIAYSIADNKANEWAQWDYYELKQLIDSISNYELEQLGFTKEEYQTLFNYEDFNPDEYFKTKEEENKVATKQESDKVICPYCGCEIDLKEIEE